MMFPKWRVQHWDGVCWCSKTTVSYSARADWMTPHVLLTSKEDVGGLEHNAVGQRNVLYSVLSYCFRSVSPLLFRNIGTPAHKD
jgi:hypothetical protein